MTNVLAIVIFLAIVAVFVILFFLVYGALSKGGDAILNAARRKEDAKNPPREENLADRYK